MRIGEVAEHVGVNAETIRQDESIRRSSPPRAPQRGGGSHRRSTM